MHAIYPATEVFPGEGIAQASPARKDGFPKDALVASRMKMVGQGTSVANCLFWWVSTNGGSLPRSIAIQVPPPKRAALCILCISFILFYLSNDPYMHLSICLPLWLIIDRSIYRFLSLSLSLYLSINLSYSSYPAILSILFMASFVSIASTSFILFL